MSEPARGPEPVPAPRPAGRGCLGCFASGGLGCTAFLGGAILAVLLFAPQLLGGWAARLVAAVLDEHVDGRVTVGGAELSWSEDLRLREVALADETGRVVARGTLRVPPLSALLEAPTTELLRFRARLQELQVGIDAEGRVDLARVLRWDSGRPERERADPVAAVWKRAREVASGEHPPFLFELDARQVDVVDARPGPGGARRGSLALRDVMAEVGRSTRSGPFVASFRAMCVVPGDGASASDGGAHLEPPGSAQTSAAAASPGLVQVSLSLDAPEAARPSGIALALDGEDLPAPVCLLLLELALGPERAAELASVAGLRDGVVDVHLSLRGDASKRAEAMLELRAGDSVMRLVGGLEGGTLRLTGAVPADAADAVGARRDAGSAAATWTVPAEALERLVAPLVPRAWTYTLDGPARVRARVDSLVCETRLGEGFAWGLTPTELVADLSVAGRVTLGGAPLDPAREEPLTYVVADPLVLVRWLGPLGGAVSVLWRPLDDGSGRAATPGRLDVRLASALDAGGGPRPRAVVDVDVPALPVALLRIGAALPLEGAALLGQEVRLRVGGLTLRGDATGPQAGAAPGPVDFALFSGQGRTPVLGRYEGGVARALPGRRQTLEFLADADHLTRVLGPVLPWLATIEPGGPGTLTVTFEALEVPLDGGSLRPTGRLELAPPPLRVRLAPAIEALFGVGEGGVATAWSPRRLRLELLDELVRYEAVELPLGGDLFPFRGSYDRKTQTLDLEGEVSARLVSERQFERSELGELLVDSELPVAVNLSGPVDAPRLFIDRAAVQGMLTRDLERALNEVVPAMRGMLEQVLPPAGATPQRPSPAPPPPADSPGGG